MMSMSKKDELDAILEEVANAYHGSNTQYRDTMLRAGRLLHNFVLGYLQQADGMEERSRIANRFSRAEALKIAAARLSCTTVDVNRFLAVAMTAELLSDNGDVGKLTFAGIAFFWRFVHRKTGKRGQTGSFPGRQEIPISFLEKWEIKPEFRDKAVALFRHAVATSMKTEEIRSAALLLYTGPTARKCHRRKIDLKQPAILTLAGCAKVASPGDVAEMCLQLIEASENPWAVSQRLMVMVQRFKKERKPMFA
jgi:hypothetical protein